MLYSEKAKGNFYPLPQMVYISLFLLNVSCD